METLANSTLKGLEEPDNLVCLWERAELEPSDESDIRNISSQK